MEEFKQLTIQSIEVVKSGLKKNGEPWTLYQVQVGNGDRYTTFLDLKPGTQSMFKVESKRSDKTDKQGRPYMNRTILAFSGPLENIQRPSRLHTPEPSSPASRPDWMTKTVPPATDTRSPEERLAELETRVDGLFTIHFPDLDGRVERLEEEVFAAANPETNPDDTQTPF